MRHSGAGVCDTTAFPKRRPELIRTGLRRSQNGIRSKEKPLEEAPLNALRQKFMHLPDVRNSPLVCQEGATQGDAAVAMDEVEPLNLGEPT